MISYMTIIGTARTQTAPLRVENLHAQIWQYLIAYLE